MKGLRKNKLLIVIIAIICFMLIGMKQTNAANETGNSAYMNLAPLNYKIGRFWTYRKNGTRTLDLYCAQHGASLHSTSKYVYSEASWDNQAGIWKSDAYESDAYEKITWIKNNFWEKTNASEGNKYTTAQKLKILQQADSTITEKDVTTVFENSNEMFKLYQEIS